MADVFVSYARVDAPFVRKLEAALRALNRDPWVDWDDIPPSAAWLQAVFSGIEGSDTFVFVTSPHSAQSRVCGLELDHAVGLNKKIIPVLAHPTDPATLPAALAALNWIDFTVESGFPDGIELLVRAMDTDLVLLKEHTRLLLRAVDWSRAGKHGSFVLRGLDLRSAVEWARRSASSHGPIPSPLHMEYISASREAARRRRRAARRQSNLAISRELAAVAIGQTTADPELAVLLAVEALGRARTPEAQDAIRRALSCSHGRVVLTADHAYLDSAAFSSDGRFVVTVGSDDVARIWDVGSSLEVRAISHNVANESDAALESAWFSPTDGYVITVGRDGRSRVWRTESGELVTETGLTARGAFDRDESLLVTSGEDAAVWDATTWRKVRSLEAGTKVSTFSEDGLILLTIDPDATLLSDPLTGRVRARLEGEFTNGTLSADGKVVALSGRDGTVWHVENAETVVLPGTCDEIAISRDGRVVASAWEDEEDVVVRLWDPLNGKALSQLRGFLSRSAGRAFSRDGNLLVTASDDNTAVVWSTRSGEPLYVLRGHRETVHSAAFDSAGTWIVTASGDGDARVWEPSGVRLTAILPNFNNVRAVAMGPTADTIATAGDHGVMCWDRSGGTVTNQWSRAISYDGGVTGRICTVTFSADGKRVIYGGDSRMCEVADTTTGAIAAALPSGPVDLAALSSAGELALTVAANTAAIWDTINTCRISGISGHDTDIASAQFAPDAASVLTAAIDGSVRIWEVESGRLLSEVHPVEERLPVVGRSRLNKPLFALAGFSPTLTGTQPTSGAEQLFALGKGPIVRIWDAAAHRVLSVLRGHSGDVTCVAFDSQGRLVATSSDDRTVRVWEARTGIAVAVLREHHDFVNAVAFSGDGTIIATGGFDNAALIYCCEVCGDTTQLLELTRARVKRALTESERHEYLRL
jgi:WD40 repeat protein